MRDVQLTPEIRQTIYEALRGVSSAVAFPRELDAAMAWLDAQPAAPQPDAPQPPQWEKVPDGRYLADEDTEWEARWEVVSDSDGVNITDCVGDFVSVGLPPGWRIMRRVEPTGEQP